MRNLELERLTLAAMSVGITSFPWKWWTAMPPTEAFGKPLNFYGQIQKAYIATAIPQYKAAKTYVYDVARKMDLNHEGQSFGFRWRQIGSHNHGENVADRAIQVLGGYGYVGEYVVERLLERLQNCWKSVGNLRGPSKIWLEICPNPRSWFCNHSGPDLIFPFGVCDGSQLLTGNHRGLFMFPFSSQIVLPALGSFATRIDFTLSKCAWTCGSLVDLDRIEKNQTGCQPSLLWCCGGFRKYLRQWNANAVMRSAEAMGFGNIHSINQVWNIRLLDESPKGRQMVGSAKMEVNAGVCSAVEKRKVKIVVTCLENSVPLQQVDFSVPVHWF